MKIHSLIGLAIAANIGAFGIANAKYDVQSYSDEIMKVCLGNSSKLSTDFKSSNPLKIVGSFYYLDPKSPSQDANNQGAIFADLNIEQVGVEYKIDNSGIETRCDEVFKTTQNAKINLLGFSLGGTDEALYSLNVKKIGEQNVNMVNGIYPWNTKDIKDRIKQAYLESDAQSQITAISSGSVYFVELKKLKKSSRNTILNIGIFTSNGDYSYDNSFDHTFIVVALDTKPITRKALGLDTIENAKSDKNMIDNISGLSSIIKKSNKETKSISSSERELPKGIKNIQTLDNRQYNIMKKYFSEDK